jgi:hypothetical protein
MRIISYTLPSLEEFVYGCHIVAIVRLFRR